VEQVPYLVKNGKLVPVAYQLQDGFMHLLREASINCLWITGLNTNLQNSESNHSTNYLFSKKGLLSEQKPFTSLMKIL
jgi:hypothetical protein